MQRRTAKNESVPELKRGPGENCQILLRTRHPSVTHSWRVRSDKWGVLSNADPQSVTDSFIFRWVVLFKSKHLLRCVLLQMRVSACDQFQDCARVGLVLIWIQSQCIIEFPGTLASARAAQRRSKGSWNQRVITSARNYALVLKSPRLGSYFHGNKKPERK